MGRGHGTYRKQGLCGELLETRRVGRRELAPERADGPQVLENIVSECHVLPPGLERKTCERELVRPTAVGCEIKRWAVPMS